MISIKLQDTEPTHWNQLHFRTRGVKHLQKNNLFLREFWKMAEQESPELTLPHGHAEPTAASTQLTPQMT